MPLVDEKDVDRIELPDGEWVDIKRRMSFYDTDRLEAEIVKLRIRGLPEGRRALKPEDFEIYEVSSGKFLLLKLNIIAWNIKATDGSIAPLDEESLRKLPSDLADIILEAIDERNQKKA